jgi:asparagine synthase (glutamine-hydrolysing)
VAAALGTTQSDVRLTGPGVLGALPHALSVLDQPTVDGFNTYFVSRSARDAGLTVALSGTGGDELFGGYPSFQYVPAARRVQAVGRLLGPAGRLAAAGLRATARRGAHRSAELFLRSDELVHSYLLRWELFLPPERRALHQLPADSDPHSGVPHEFLDDLRADPDPDPINQVSRFELRGYMGQMLLRDADVLSMANQIELRVPLLDHPFVESVLRMPGGWKRPDPRPKPLLVDAVGPRLPAWLHNAPKKGFSLPWRQWLRGPLRGWARDAVRDESVWKALEFDPSYPVRLWRRFDAGDRRIADMQIMAFGVLAEYVTRQGLRV